MGQERTGNVTGVVHKVPSDASWLLPFHQVPRPARQPSIPEEQSRLFAARSDLPQVRAGRGESERPEASVLLGQGGGMGGLPSPFMLPELVPPSKGRRSHGGGAWKPSPPLRPALALGGPGYPQVGEGKGSRNQNMVLVLGRSMEM